MRRFVVTVVALAVGACLLSSARAAQHAPKALATTAADVIERNVSARGGLIAWRKVNSMMWFGHLERGGKTDQHIPFVMQLERPNRTRFEIKERYSQFTRIFDGDHGWKVRPGSNGQPDLKSFSKEETSYARDEFSIDGPLIDYQAKGITASLDGIDNLDGRKAYRLSLKLPSGAPRKVWIDVKTNLEIRSDRPATNPLAPGAPVSTYYASYTRVDGLQIPNSLVVSSGAAPTATVAPGAFQGAGDQLVIDRVILNPTLEKEAFLPPPTPMRRGGKVFIPSDGLPTGTVGQAGP